MRRDTYRIFVDHDIGVGVRFNDLAAQRRADGMGLIQRLFAVQLDVQVHEHAAAGLAGF